MLYCLQFLAVAEVAAVAEAGNDVFVLVHAGVDGGAPDGGLVLGQGFLDHVDAFGSGYDAGDVDVSGRACFGQGLVGGGHASAGGKHGVGNDERLALDARRGHVFGMHAHLGVLAVGVHAVGRNEGAVGMVEHVLESIVEGESGAEHSGQQHVVLGQLYVERAQGSGDGFWLVAERFRDFVGHQLSYTKDVVTKQQTVLLVFLVSEFSHVLVDDAVLFSEVDDVHGGIVF